MDRLAYRRQFILARAEIAPLSEWNTVAIESYRLYTHPDLDVTEAADAARRIILIGYLFDSENERSGNAEVVNGLLRSSSDFRTLLCSIKRYAGRYVLIYKDARSFHLFHDALALREVYYCRNFNRVICASQPNLLQKFSAPRINESNDPDLLEFIRSHLPHVRNGRLWPGEGTAFEGVRHLLPNHCLDVARLRSFRYWPNEPLEACSLDAAVAKCSKFLQGTMRAAAQRNTLMMAVTAGEDSRCLLAASKQISDRIYFFINRHPRLNEQSNDIRIPRAMFKELCIPFNVHQYANDVPGAFRDLFYANTHLAKPTYLPVIYNIYHKQHSDKLNILGVGEVGRTKFFDAPKKIEPYYLAYMLRHRNSIYAVKECARWLEAALPVVRLYGLNVMTLFWWEVLIGNWGAVGNSESDIAVEEFDPYNCHLLYETFLSVAPKYRTFKNNILFRRLIENMWPELLKFPINPPDNLKSRLLWAASRLKVESRLRRLKYRMYALRFGTARGPGLEIRP